MVTALQDQKIYRRNSKGNPRRIHPGKKKSNFNVKNRFLTFLFYFTIILLLCASLLFSLAMMDTGHKPIALQDTILNDDDFKEILNLEKSGISGTGNSTNISETQLAAATDTAGNKTYPEGVSITGNNIPREHIIKKGNTIYGISRQYNVSLYELIFLNNIHDPTKLRVNDKILLPQGKEHTGNSSYPINLEKSSNLPATIEIAADVLSGTAPLKVNFKLKNALKSRSLIYIWDFGNDKFAFTLNAETEYITSGEYRVFLMISDQENNEIISNKLVIKVYPPDAKTVKVKTSNVRTTIVPDKYFLTADQLNDVIDFRDYIEKDLQEKNPAIFDMANTKIEQSVALLKQIEPDKFLTVNSGYAKIRISNGSYTFSANLFVSPYPSRQAFEPAYDWYKTQFMTGFNGNCGPACVAMAIHWAKEDAVSVAAIRNEIGMPIKSGAIGFNHMFAPFKTHKTNAFYTTINEKKDLFKIIDRGNIAIFVYYTGKIAKTTGDAALNLVGRYYEDVTGHYSIVKGYTLDKKYFIVYDPIPGDWDENNIRYKDDTSMIGRNRYYPVEELMSSLRDNQVVEISRG